MKARLVEERQVGVAVGVRGRAGEVVAALGGELADRRRLPLPVAGPEGAPRGDAALQQHRQLGQAPFFRRGLGQGVEAPVVVEEQAEAGGGFASSSQGGRVGFSTTGLVEYAPDFLMKDGAMYVYFRPKVVDATGFQTLLVESQLAASALKLFGIDANAFGQKVVEGQLRLSPGSKVAVRPAKPGPVADSDAPPEPGS